jgi:hypothetical protein
MLGKVPESVIAQQILSLSVKHMLLTAWHMGAHTGRSKDTTLDFLVQHIHATRQNKDDIAMLLLLSTTGAFDIVVPAQLLHNMREKNIPELIVKWVGNFISNRTTTQCLPGDNTKTFPIYMGIPQGLPLSPILIHFYNANLVEACNPPTLSALGTSFVDNVNALPFGKLME